ncbi:MAG: 50S ribosomal protein L10 [Paludibacteraceae bacterium]|nr:50S ribosomal protein L10 [Paludibacteraceae bacterium]
MKREDKKVIIDSLTEQVKASSHFYLIDMADFNASATSKLRRECFKSDIKLVLVKNTLLAKALENAGDKYKDVHCVLKGTTSIMFCEIGNAPAKLIKEFKKTNKKLNLKAAFVEESAYVGADSLETLVNIKSKNELIADIVALLQSPAKNVISALQSGGNIITGVLKTLEEKKSE